MFRSAIPFSNGVVEPPSSGKKEKKPRKPRKERSEKKEMKEKSVASGDGTEVKKEAQSESAKEALSIQRNLKLNAAVEYYLDMNSMTSLSKCIEKFSQPNEGPKIAKTALKQ